MASDTPETAPIRVLVVDDKALFREGLVSLLAHYPEIAVVGQAEDGYKALERARQLQPQLILMDVDMPNCDGIKATRLIKEELPQIDIIMLTVSEEDKNLFTAIKEGAKGYLIKDINVDELIKAIVVVSRGGAVVSPSMAVKLLNEFSNVLSNPKPTPAQPTPPTRSDLQTLSDRELEVLRLVATGATNRDIAESLFISENTVKAHLRNIMDKLHLRNRHHAVAYAFREGLVNEPPTTPTPEKK